MYCQNCGNELEPGTFCPCCEKLKHGTAYGAEQITSTTTTQQPRLTPYPPQYPVAKHNVTSEQNYYQTQLVENPTRILVLCIIGLATFGTGIIGLIFSIIGLSQATKHIATYGNSDKKVKIGKSISTIGFVLSLIVTFFWICLCVFWLYGVSL